MIKGVNKLIVEVSNPDSEFFEKAIFFVKPQMKDAPPGELNKSANTLIREAGTQREKAKLAYAVALAGAMAVGAAIAAVVFAVM